MEIISPYPHPAFHFKVVFALSSGITDMSFQEVSGIGPEIQSEDVTEGGENRFVHRLPKGVKHPRLVLKRGVASQLSPLVRWCRKVLEGDFSEPIVPTQVGVTLLDEKGIPVAVWSVTGAYPVKWEIEAFNSTKNDVAIEKIELNYSYSTREV